MDLASIPSRSMGCKLIKRTRSCCLVSYQTTVALCCTLQPALIPVKILYTFDAASATTCLARSSSSYDIKVLYTEDHTPLGIVDLQSCIRSISASSPEIMFSSLDYAVYSVDHTEPGYPFVGHGLLNALMASKHKVDSVYVVGRVCTNILALFSGGTKETLEVRLRLIPTMSIPTTTSGESFMDTATHSELDQMLYPHPLSPANMQSFLPAQQHTTHTSPPQFQSSPYRTSSPDQFPSSPLSRKRHLSLEHSESLMSGERVSSPLEVKEIKATVTNTGSSSRAPTPVSSNENLPSSDTSSMASTIALAAATAVAASAAITNKTKAGPKKSRKDQIEKTLFEAMERGQVPDYCANCGALSTVTWRRVKGPSQNPDEPSMEYLLCNPCGLWFTSKKVMRPRNLWKVDEIIPKPTDQKESHKRKKPRGRSVKADKSKSLPVAAFPSEGIILPKPDNPSIARTLEDYASSRPKEGTRAKESVMAAAAAAAAAAVEASNDASTTSSSSESLTSQETVNVDSTPNMSSSQLKDSRLEVGTSSKEVSEGSVTTVSDENDPASNVASTSPDKENIPPSSGYDSLFSTPQKATSSQAPSSQDHHKILSQLNMSGSPWMTRFLGFPNDTNSSDLPDNDFSIFLPSPTRNKHDTHDMTNSGFHLHRQANTMPSSPPGFLHLYSDPEDLDPRPAHNTG